MSDRTSKLIDGGLFHPIGPVNGDVVSRQKFLGIGNLKNAVYSAKIS